MKHVIYRSYLLFALMVYNPGITLATSPANPTQHQEQPVEGVWQNIQKNIDGVLPTRGSKITVAIPTVAFLATLLLTWKFWPKKGNILPNETLKVSVEEIGTLNQKIEELKEELKKKQLQINMNQGQMESIQETNAKLRDVVVKNATEFRLFKETAPKEGDNEIERLDETLSEMLKELKRISTELDAQVKKHDELVKDKDALLRMNGELELEKNNFKDERDQLSLRAIPQDVQMNAEKNNGSEIYSLQVPDNMIDGSAKNLLEQVSILITKYNELVEKYNQIEKEYKEERELNKKERELSAKALHDILSAKEEIEELLKVANTNLQDIKMTGLSEGEQEKIREAQGKIKAYYENQLTNESMIMNGDQGKNVLDGKASMVWGQQYHPSSKKTYVEESKIEENTTENGNFIGQPNYRGVTGSIYRFGKTISSFNNKNARKNIKVAVIYDDNVFNSIICRYPNLWKTILKDKAKSLIEKIHKGDGDAIAEIMYVFSNNGASLKNYVQQENISEDNKLNYCIALGNVNFMQLEKELGQNKCYTDTLICAGLNNKDRAWCESNAIVSVFTADVSLINIITDDTKKIAGSRQRSINNGKIKRCINVSYNRVEEKDGKFRYYRLCRDAVSVNFFFDIPKFIAHMIKSNGYFFDCKQYCYTQGANKLSFIDAPIYKEENGHSYVDEALLFVFLESNVVSFAPLRLLNSVFGQVLIRNTKGLNQGVGFKKLPTCQEENRELIVKTAASVSNYVVGQTTRVGKTLLSGLCTGYKMLTQTDLQDAQEAFTKVFNADFDKQINVPNAIGNNDTVKNNNVIEIKENGLYPVVDKRLGQTS